MLQIKSIVKDHLVSAKKISRYCYSGETGRSASS